jgi:UDP-N-acetylglucosamine 2-epimerase (non-hydrolysing)/UDP-GlcNAc3NAcA epimerase
MKVVTVVGARPQFVKAAAVSRLLRRQATEIMVHTGQHYDANMSDVFFEELEIPPPDYHLGVGSGSHGTQTGVMLARIEEVLQKETPDWLLVYGDTNSTLAGALAAAKLHIRIAHAEAGLRSYNRDMPEEINRVLTDHLSDLLFCPSDSAVQNLAKEGITRGVHIVGDVMADTLLFAAERSKERSTVLDRLGLTPGGYLLATVHRAENTDPPDRLQKILEAFASIQEPLIFLIHPRTRKRVAELGLESLLDGSKVRFVEPQGYLDMVRLEQSARMILTDSGGIQKEAYWLNVPCITLRNETEWVETVELGWNCLADADFQYLANMVHSFTPPSNYPPLYGDGKIAHRIIEHLVSHSAA